MKVVKIFLFLLIFFNVISVKADNFYWVGGSGLWTDPNHWSDIPGGFSTGKTPSSSDNVFFDDKSFTAPGQEVRINTFAMCKNMDWSSVTNLPTLVDDGNIGHYLTLNGSLTLSANMIFNYEQKTIFRASTSGNKIIMNGRSFKSDIFFSNSGSWTISGDLEVLNGGIHLNQGELIVKGDIRSEFLDSSSSSSRSLILSDKNIVLTATNKSVISINTTNLAVNAGTSSISILNQGASIDISGDDSVTLNSLSFASKGAVLNTSSAKAPKFNSFEFLSEGSINGNNNFGDLIFTGGFNYSLGDNTSLNVSGTFIAKGDCSSFVDISGVSTNTIIKAANVDLKSIIVSNVVAKGSAVPFKAVDSFDNGNCNPATGWEIVNTAPRIFRWTGNAGDTKWSNALNWDQNCVPTQIDNVIIDAGDIVSVDVNAYCKNIEIKSGKTITGNSALSIYGSLISNTATWSLNGDVYFSSKSSTAIDINMGGQDFDGNVYFVGTADYSLKSSLDLGTYNLSLKSGSLITNSEDVKAGAFSSDGTLNRSLKLSNSVFTISGDRFSVEGSNFSINGGEIRLIGNNTVFENNHDTDIHYAKLTFAVLSNADISDLINASSTSLVYIDELNFNSNSKITGNHSFGVLNLNPGSAYELSKASVQKITGSLNAVGSCSSFISIFSVDGQATVFSDVDIDAKYCRIDNVKAEGSGKHNASGSIEIGGTSNSWSFVLPASQDLYWTGADDSNWFNSNNWSPSCVPTRVDNVFFDASRLAVAGSKDIFVSGMALAAECNNMTWLNAGPGSMFSGTADLNIFGSLDLNGIVDNNFRYDGNVYFKSIKAEDIYMAGCSFKKNVFFTGSKQSSGKWKAGSWDFKDNFTCLGGLILEQGEINTLNNEINIATLNSSFDKTRSLNLGDSKVFLDRFEVSPVNFFLDAGMSTITFGKNPVITVAKGSNAIKFYDIIFSQNEGVGNINALADNITFNNITLNCNTNILEESISINKNLNLNQGKTYRFSTGQTYVIGNLSALGGCDGAIDISTTSAGTSTIFKSSNVINVQGVILKDIHAEGNFTADESIDLGNNDNWTINKASRGKNLFWVQGTGDWDDKSHWSYSSGGVGGACLPTALDNVIFDSKSFSIPGQFVYTGASDIRCRTMDWTGVSFNPTFKSKGDIYGVYIYGSLILSDKMSVDLSENIDFYFRSSSQGQIIKTASFEMPGNVYFDGYDAVADKIGEWTLEDNLSVNKELFLTNGFFKTDGHDLNVRAIFSEHETGTPHKGFDRILDIENSTVTIQGNGLIKNGVENAGEAIRITTRDLKSRDQSFNLLSANSNIIVENKASIYVLGTRKYTFYFNNVEFKKPGKFYVKNSKFVTASLLMNDDGEILGDNTFEKLELTEGKTYKLEGDKTVTVDEFIAQGTCNFPISISSSVDGFNATIKSVSKNIKLNFVHLKDLFADISTGNTYTVDNAFDNGNNTNWILNDRDPVDLYWVGNGATDDWHDYQNWAKTSGGVDEACVPTLIDNVFFDENSFLVSKLAEINSPAYCNNIHWSDNVDPNSAFNVKETLEVYGNLKFVSNMSLDCLGVFSFKGNGLDQTKTIDFARKSFDGDVIFDGLNQKFLLESKFTTTANIKLLSGSLNTQDNNIGTGQFIVDGTNNDCKLEIGNSKISLSSKEDQALKLTGSNLDIVSDMSRIEFLNGGGLFYDCAGKKLKLHDLIFEDNGIINIKSTGEAVFNNVKFIERSQIFGNNRFSSLELSIGYDNTIESGKIIFVVDEFIMEGVTCEKAWLSSSTPGKAAHIQSRDGKIKVYHASLQDIHALSFGSADFSINGSFDDRGGNMRWKDKTPADDDIEAPSFKQPMPDHIEYCSEKTKIDDVLAFPISKNTIFQWYKWNGIAWDIIPGETNATFNVKEEGKYRIELVYNPKCRLFSEIEIKIDKSVKKLNLDIEPLDITCFKTSDGSIKVIPSDGYPGYLYSWYDKDDKLLPTLNSDIIIDLEPGEYKVKVTDSKACSEEITAIIHEAYEIVYDGVNHTDINCFGESTGELTINAKGGFGVLEYSINGILQADKFKSNLSAGDYVVYAQDEKKCKTTVETISVLEPDEITFDWVTDGLKCFGDTDGTLDPQISGGIPAYSYDWTGPNSMLSTDVALSKLSGGKYTLTVKDHNSCEASEEYIIQEPEKLENKTILTKPINCYGDNKAQLFIEASKGTAPYSYRLNTDTNSTGVFSNLPAGDYNINIQDANMCISNYNYKIKEPKAIVLAVNDNIAPTCPLLKDGFIEISSFEGTGRFNFSWTGPNDFRADTEDIDKLESGDYNLVVTDSLNCIKTLDVNLKSEIKLQLGLRVNDNVTKANAKDGSFSIEIIGGKPNYKFTVDGPSSYKFVSPPDFYDNLFTLNDLSGGVYKVTLEDQANCKVITKTIIVEEEGLTFAKIVLVKDISCFSFNDGSLKVDVPGVKNFTVSWSSDNGFSGVGQMVDNLSAGVYTAVINANGQVITDTYTVVEPSALVVTVENIQPPLCHNESTARVEIKIEGGSPRYKVEWLGPNGFLSKAEKILDISAGRYSYTVTDANNCVFKGNADVVQPNKLEIESITEKEISAIGLKDGEINWTVKGGTSDYVYFLTGPNDYSYKNPADNSGIDSRSSLRNGLYTLEVLDKNQCRQEKTVKIHEPERLIVFPTNKVDLTCNASAQGAISVDVVKGDSKTSYADKCSYTWEGPDFFKANTKDITGLLAGKYKLTATDITTGEQVFLEVNINEPKKIELEFKTDNISCYGEVDGYINLFPKGGTPAYRYVWTGHNVVPSSEDQKNLLPGDYSVKVIDANKCESEEVSFTISDVQNLDVTSKLTRPSCFGSSDGEIELTLSDKQGVYIINWDDYGSILFNVENIYAKDYSYTIEDAKGCEHKGKLILTEPDKLKVEIKDFEDSICFGDELARAKADVSGGTREYSFKWTNSQTTQESTNLEDGENKVVVTDANMCVDSAFVTISNPKEIALKVSIRRPQTVSSNDGLINIQADGGAGSFTIDWMQLSKTDFRVENLAPKVYEAHIQDANMCRRDTTIVLKELFAEKVIIPKGFSPNNDGINDDWTINRVQYVLDLKINIYDRWGKSIYLFNGSGFEYEDNKWDGTSNGKILVSGTYYYSIELDGEKPIVGSVTIVR